MSAGKVFIYQNDRFVVLNLPTNQLFVDFICNNYLLIICKGNLSLNKALSYVCPIVVKKKFLHNCRLQPTTPKFNA